MGGNSHGEGNITVCGEFNFHADPEAAKVVIDRMECAICIVPWETCRNTNITWVSFTTYSHRLNLQCFDIIIDTNYDIISFWQNSIHRTGEKMYSEKSTVHK